MQHHTFSTVRTAHYHTLGQPGPAVSQLWIVCHGYGQLADAFLADFQPLVSEKTWVVAPEGLNHFYKKGFSGDVAANWMTRHYRDTAIADNAEYLQGLYEHLLAQLSPHVRIILLGFSQGTATVCRWILHKKPVFHDLVLWAGLPPEDLEYKPFQDYLGSKNLYLLYGTSDPFLTPDHLATLRNIEAESGLDFEEKTFHGGHEIDSDALDALRRTLQ